ncbi:conjugal transfer protein MobA [Chitinophaga pollutisoli]|uniref:Conjugal transfer protein MobA n=1 Tax=Chitinophaga pollutisoli TaxID=3133966 RepID=A0ABZ2YRZ0_9BACT
MEEKDSKQIRKTGRKPKIDPAVHRYSINLNAEDNAKFLALFDQSGMKIIAHFITACIFDKTVKTVKIDMDAVEYHEKLTRFFSQFRGIGTNYNQIVKLLYRNFSEKKPLHTFLRWKKKPLNW